MNARPRPITIKLTLNQLDALIDAATFATPYTDAGWTDARRKSLAQALRRLQDADHATFGPSRKRSEP